MLNIYKLEGLIMTRYNIYRRKDGGWEGRIPRGKKPNGKRKFKYIFGISKEQVRK